MEYERFYRLCLDYDFMFNKAVHFGVYSENRLEGIQNELGELLKIMAADPVYAQYKPLLQEMHQTICSRSDIGRFLLSAQNVQKKIKVQKLAGDIPLYMLCVSVLVIAGMLPVISGL
ncbi:MAG: hypothetical protein K2N89_03540 [Lachnospiraceae bacterium]|nr:hypothetical protein [Lachnospiraceae bacterium]